MVVQSDIKHHVKQLTKGIEKLQQDILSHIDKDPCLKNQKNLLLSIPGIGEKTISKLLSYFSSVERFDNAKKMASFCGIAPREFQSGSDPLIGCMDEQYLWWRPVTKMSMWSGRPLMNRRAFQRAFKRWAGHSLKQYSQCVH
jgi:hypothetical protein